MPIYKVLVDSVTMDDVEFKKDEILELEADALNVPELLSGGSIVEVSPEEIPGGDDEIETPPSEGTHQADEGVA